MGVLAVAVVKGETFGEQLPWPSEQVPFALLWHTPFPEPTIDREGFSDTSTSTSWSDDGDDKD